MKINTKSKTTQTNMQRAHRNAVTIYTGPFYGLSILRDDTGHVTFSDDDGT